MEAILDEFRPGSVQAGSSRLSNSERVTLHIALFGRPRLRLDDAPLCFSVPPRALPLLGYLLLNRGGPVKRERLATMLWPDDDEDEARANLRRHLHHLQRALNPNGDLPPPILSDRTTVSWNPLMPLRFDVEEFERLSASPATLDDAIAMYDGDLLDGLYDEWVFPERERLRLLFIADLSALALESRSRRAFGPALAYVQRILQTDAWREDALRQSMTLRFEIGDRAGALAEYLEFAKRLRREMDLEPMPETSAVYDTIRRNAAELPASAERAVPEARAPSVLPFIGRDEIFASLTARWAQAARGRGSTVLLSGEAGIGKSRLAAELALLAESEGARVLFGAASAVESSPYDAVTQALRAALPLFAHVKLEPVWRAALGVVLPELRSAHESGGLPPLEPGREQLRLFEAVAQLLLALAKTRPVLIVIEDVHLAGAGTASLLGYLGGRIATAHLLVVVTYRGEEAARAHPVRTLRRLLERDDVAKHIALGPLSRDAVATIAKAGNRPELADRLYEESEGNPFFLTEMLRSHSEGNDALAGVDGIASWISARTARLSMPAQTLVEAASVIGASFDVELLKDVCEWDESTMLGALDEALDRQLIRESASGPWDYAFSHHLIHAALYERSSLEVRKRRHRRVARALLELYPDRLDDLAARIAFHLERAGDGAAAAPYYLHAARSAQRLFANLEAVEMAKRGIDVCEDPAIRVTLALLLENLYARIGDRVAQATQLATLEREIASDTRSSVRNDLLLRRIALHHGLGEREREAAVLRELEERCAAAPDAASNASRLIALALYNKAIGEDELALVAAREALAIQAVEAEPASYGASLCMLAELLSGAGREAEASDALAQARRLAEADSDSLLSARVLRAGVKLAMDARAFGSARELGERLLALCEVIGDREGAADAHAGLGAAIGRAFDVSLAETHYVAGAEIYRSLGKPQGEAVVSLNLGTLRLLTGDCREALRAYGRARPLFRTLKDLRGELLCALNASVCELYLANPAAAAEDARVALRLARLLTSRSLEAHALANLGAAERDSGDGSGAIAHMAEGIAIRRTLNEGADLAADLCDLGLAYLKEADSAGAGRVLADFESVAQADVDRMMFPQYFNLVKSALLDAAGKHDEARAATAVAHAEYERRLAAIPDSRARPMYRTLPFNREIVTKVEGAERG